MMGKQLKFLEVLSVKHQSVWKLIWNWHESLELVKLTELEGLLRIRISLRAISSYFLLATGKYHTNIIIFSIRWHSSAVSQLSQSMIKNLVISRILSEYWILYSILDKTSIYLSRSLLLSTAVRSRVVEKFLWPPLLPATRQVRPRGLWGSHCAGSWCSLPKAKALQKRNTIPAFPQISATSQNQAMIEILLANT